MKWPIALSFSGIDLDFAREVSRLITAVNIGSYCYYDKLAPEAGDLLFEKHENLFSSALTIGMFLRSDFLDRVYTAFEYRLMTARADFPACATLFVMERSAAFLVPTGAFRGLADSAPSALTPQACAAVLITRVRTRFDGDGPAGRPA